MSVPIDDVEQDAQIAEVFTIRFRLADRQPRTLTVEAPNRDAAVAQAVRELAERYSAPLRSWAPWLA